MERKVTSQDIGLPGECRKLSCRLHICSRKRAPRNEICLAGRISQKSVLLYLDSTYLFVVTRDVLEEFQLVMLSVMVDWGCSSFQVISGPL